MNIRILFMKKPTILRRRRPARRLGLESNGTHELQEVPVAVVFNGGMFFMDGLGGFLL